MAGAAGGRTAMLAGAAVAGLATLIAPAQAPAGRLLPLTAAG